MRSSFCTELCFSSLAWPDFNRTELWKARKAYAGRECRYGGTVDRVLREESTGVEGPEDDEEPHIDGRQEAVLSLHI